MEFAHTDRSQTYTVQKILRLTLARVRDRGEAKERAHPGSHTHIQDQIQKSRQEKSAKPVFATPDFFVGGTKPAKQV
jgi:hypothetical protein